jgi:hypothetical protein
MESLSRHFLGRPYIANSLVGSASTPEVFTVSLDAFDCVTYMEAVLALAASVSAQDFIPNLQQIRYNDGKIAWLNRNHYMTDWINNNVRAGWVRRVRLRAPGVHKEKLLNILPGYPPIRRRIAVIPKRALAEAAADIQSGDLIFFASTRAHNDVFHCGIVIRKDGALLLRHASRSRKAVVEQTLESFLRQNRMAGVVLVRPAFQKAA